MAIFAKRHYEAIAAALKEAKADIRRVEPDELQMELLDGVDYARDCLILAFKRDSPNFKPEKFKEACD